MDNFVIKDCVQLRALACKYAMMFIKLSSLKGVDRRRDEFTMAENFFNYIKGDADIPEYISPNHELDRYLDILGNVSNNATTYSFMWAKPEELLPPTGMKVLVMYRDYKNDALCGFGKYSKDGVWYLCHNDKVLSSKNDDLSILSWCPIPKYKL